MKSRSYVCLKRSTRTGGERVGVQRAGDLSAPVVMVAVNLTGAPAAALLVAILLIIIIPGEARVDDK